MITFNVLEEERDIYYSTYYSTNLVSRFLHIKYYSSYDSIRKKRIQEAPRPTKTINTTKITQDQPKTTQQDKGKYPLAAHIQIRLNFLKALPQTADRIRIPTFHIRFRRKLQSPPYTLPEGASTSIV
ncbi:predicted protein [Sclerotinia sclerotiorum 1980 UF-70]|uniref:Uncharacterized protein n=1 Tax=Sclerotinia sclerotiorum (strain ATCC 18683 / 1980 / Ss-1) TaxID=665079 RepID=A7EXE4_SCLS1|nr:predicted protein [Sclerotinia sclerotiorum 1980 UF-70]EDN94136.1 predicted protein [Sclerotinia sclerotiorum 1980 UF-70]